MKKKIDQIILKLRENKPALEEKYVVNNLEVFGSYIRSEQKKAVTWMSLRNFQKLWYLKREDEFEACIDQNS